jgi:hypothetical protein
MISKRNVIWSVNIINTSRMKQTERDGNVSSIQNNTFEITFLARKPRNARKSFVTVSEFRFQLAKQSGQSMFCIEKFDE